MEVEPSSSKKKKKSTSDSGESRLTYLQLRSRSIFMKPRISKNPSNSDRPPYRSSDNTLISLSSSCSSTNEGRDGPDSGVACLEFNSRSDDQESTAGRRREARRGSTVRMTPVEEEIEEFLADAEIVEKKRFVNKYNFDILKGVPLEGRYEWVRM